MELHISVGFPNGQITAKVDTFAEADVVRDWLAKQGLINGVPKQAETQVEREPFEPGADIYPTTSEATEPAQAEVDAEAEAARVAAELEAAAAEQAKAEKAEKAAKAAARKAAKEAKPANDIQAVTKAVTDYAAKFGPTEARALFARFGVSRGGDLKPEQFDEFVSVAIDYLARGIKATEGDTADLM
jgi:membrane protein involved in colicin uptake